MSIAMHSHRCDITLVPIKGSVFNVVPSAWSERVLLIPHRFESFIDGKGKVIPTQGAVWSTGLSTSLIMEPLSMSAREYHTIYVPQCQETAWLVKEGDLDPLYNPIMYSDHVIQDTELEGLYQKDQLTPAEFEIIKSYL